MSEPKKDGKSFARIILINLVLLVLLIALGLAAGDFGFATSLLMLLALVNVAKAFDGNKAAHLLSALVLLIVGLGQCGMPIGTH